VTSGALPRFDAGSRVAKLRLEADNPGLTLRPEMLVDVELSIGVPEVTTVPASAVIHAGATATVFVDRGDGHFEPRTVVTGRRFGDRVEIADGLDPGESIVVGGAFLVDAERRMRRADASGPR
jgi:Cu(I)/Ag(I) efflux system membrane fusion protein